MGPRHGGESEKRVSRDEICDPADAGGRRRLDHQHLVDCGDPLHRRAVLDLLCEQGDTQPHLAYDRRGIRGEENPRQRDPAGPDANADGGEGGGPRTILRRRRYRGNVARAREASADGLRRRCLGRGMGGGVSRKRRGALRHRHRTRRRRRRDPEICLTFRKPPSIRSRRPRPARSAASPRSTNFARSAPSAALTLISIAGLPAFTRFRSRRMTTRTAKSRATMEPDPRLKMLLKSALFWTGERSEEHTSEL